MENESGKIVSIVNCKTYDREKIEKSVNLALNSLKDIKSIIKPGMHVSIKPNLLRGMKPERAGTTHPEVVRAVIRFVKECGAFPLLCESPGGPAAASFVKNVYNTCGIAKIAQEEDCEIDYALRTIEIKVPEAKYIRRMSILKGLADADLIINIPKPKAHGMMTYTGAVKNMFGAVAGVTKANYHLRQSDYNDFANAIIDIYLGAKPGINIMDAVEGMHQRGPSSGVPRHIGYIIASQDAFALDYTVLKLLKRSMDDIPVLTMGMERGLCPKDIETLEYIVDGSAGKLEEKLLVDGFIIPNNLEAGASSPFKKWINKSVTAVFRQRPVFKKRKCKKCNICIQNCPAKCLEMGEYAPKVDLSKCIRCFCCEELCPYEAIDIRRI